MRKIAPHAQYVCRYRHAFVYYCLHNCIARAMPIQPLAAPGTSGRTRTHALHVRITACKFYLRTWSLRAAGLALN